MTIHSAAIWDSFIITDLWGKMVEEINIPNRNADIAEKERYLLSLMVKIKKPDCGVFVAKKGDEIIGYISGYLKFLDYGSSSLIGVCDAIYIKPEHRDGFISCQLIEELSEFCRKNGAKEFQFETKYDPDLAKVWERKGFKPIHITYMREV